MKSESFSSLVDYLSSQNESELSLSISHIEEIIKDSIPNCAYYHTAWWRSSGSTDHRHVWITQQAGWKAYPKSNANKVIIEVIFKKEASHSKVENKPEIHRNKSVKTRSDIITPCPKEVQKYLDKWNNLGSYVVQEEALDDLYMKTYPFNTDIKQVIIKVSALNDFYSTNIFKVYSVARHIIELNIDERLARNDVTLVNDIANVKVQDQTKQTDEKYINFYSFATKYCSRHKPKEYPIFDSYVEKLLKYFRDADQRISFKDADLKDYSKYKTVLLDFQKQYKLEPFNLKQIDKYLWQLGKEKFPKNYGKKKEK